MSFRPWPKKQFVRNAQPTEVNGHAFPSKLEAAVYHYLLKREQLGEIREILMQQTVVLQGGPRETRITWRVDFSFIRRIDAALVYVEAKGFATDVYKLKLKLYRFNPPADLEIYGGSYTRLVMLEKISKGKST